MPPDRKGQPQNCHGGLREGLALQSGCSRGGSGTGAFRVSSNFDSPSCLVRAASNPIIGDTRFAKAVDEIVTPTILTWGSLLRRTDTVSRLSCSGVVSGPGREKLVRLVAKNDTENSYFPGYKWPQVDLEGTTAR